MTITAPIPIPPAGLPLPNPADRATFSARKLEQLRWANNEYATGSKALADASYSNALDSQASATGAAASASSAATAALNSAAAANFKGNWSSLTGALNKPASVQHNGALWALLNNLGNVTASQPGVSADWVVVGGAFPVLPISTNTTAAPGKTYLITEACTLTLPAISGNGKQVSIVVLDGVSGVVVAPAATNKIRGVAGNMTVDSTPFSETLTDTGATYGWI